jgi:hypothetical protein
VHKIIIPLEETLRVVEYDSDSPSPSWLSTLLSTPCATAGDDSTINTNHKGCIEYEEWPIIFLRQNVEVLRDFRVNTWHLEMSYYLRIVRQGRALIIYYGGSRWGHQGHEICEESAAYAALRHLVL